MRKGNLWHQWRQWQCQFCDTTSCQKRRRNTPLPPLSSLYLLQKQRFNAKSPGQQDLNLSFVHHQHITVFEVCGEHLVDHLVRFWELKGKR
jgi:hypothetical protein